MTASSVDASRQLLTSTLALSAVNNDLDAMDPGEASNQIPIEGYLSSGHDQQEHGGVIQPLATVIS
jgi:hypothetical protein